ncbi:hypothetical protein AB4Z29_19190 [Paenibacillus sp. 2TAB23]|uniref:hypothetical protein n=1 Tax=Paenibacillus sp. 2TAB23 TaxID=3233004 RepID=UPI003F961D45
MRRYWFSILIVLLAAGGIGTYYLIGIRDHLPEYIIETVQGDAKEGAAVVLSGSHYGAMRSEPLDVTTEGSKYLGKNLHLRERMANAGKWFYHDLNIQQLLKDHKAFMRGKNNSGRFYRDAEMVIYAKLSTSTRHTNAPYAKLELSMLDEATGKVATFKSIALDEPEQIYNIMNVQRIDNEVHILFHKYESHASNLVVYAFDSGTGKQLRRIDLKSQLKSTAADYDLSLIANESVSRPSDIIYFTYSEGSEALNRKNYAYSYRTGKLSELSETLWGPDIGEFFTYSLQQDQFYYAEIAPDEVVLSLYHTKTKARKRAYATVTAKQLGVDEIQSVQIQRDRAYLGLEKAGVKGAAVLRLEDGKLLFEGFAVQASGNGQTDEEMKRRLHLNNVVIERKL